MFEFQTKYVYFTLGIETFSITNWIQEFFEFSRFKT